MDTDGNGATAPASEAEAEQAPAATPHELHPTEPRRGSKPLPTNRIAFAKQLDLLRAYAAASGIEGKPVSLASAAEMVRLNAATASLANGFLVDAKLLVKSDTGQLFTPVKAVHDFSQAYSWDKDTAAHKLAPVLRTSWGYEALKPRLDYQATIHENEAIRLLAEACGASPDYRPQLLLVIAYLEAAGLVARDGANIRRVADSAQPAGPTLSAADAPPAGERSSGAAASRLSGGGTSTSSGRPEGQIRFAVSVNIDVAELRGWSPDRIAKLFSGISDVLAAKGDTPDSEEEEEQ